MTLGPDGGLLIYTIYQGLPDYPEHPFVVIAFEVAAGGPRPLPDGFGAATLEGARALIPVTADARFDPSEGDDEHIVESWM